MIGRSSGRGQYDDTVGYGSLETSGGDLSNYREQLKKDRNSRTLGLRRISRPSILSFHSSVKKRTSSPLLRSMDLPCLNPENVMSIISSGDNGKICSLLSDISDTSQNIPKLVQKLLKNEEIIQIMAEILSNEHTEDVYIQALQTISEMFKVCTPEQQTLFCDNDLAFSLLNFISSDSAVIVTAAIQFIDTVSGISSYALDSIISFGLHTMLIDIAKNPETPEEITEAACEALRKIFQNEEDVDNAVVIDAWDPMCELLALQYQPALRSVIDCFVEMTNKVPSIVLKLFESGIYRQIIGFLDEEGLVGVALRLIGNMSVTLPNELKMMLELNLFDILVGFLQTDYATYVFWIFSNMLESVPHLMLPLFSDALISEVVETVSGAAVDVKMEAAFFLSTLILFSQPEDLGRFLVHDVIDVLAEMVGCGVVMIVLRCIDTLIRFAHAAAQGTLDGSALASLLTETDLEDRRDDVTALDSVIATERMDYLFSLIDMLG